MSEHKLVRYILDKSRYEYLSKEDSDLYDSLENDQSEAAKIARRLIEEKAQSSKHEHSMERY